MDDSLREARGEAMDPARLLAGEDPDSDDLEDARHWRSVYAELLAFKQQLLNTATQDLPAMREGAAREEALSTDMVVLQFERDRLQRRFDHWDARCTELSQK